MPRILNGWWVAGVGGGIASVGRLSPWEVVAQWDNAGGTSWLREAPQVAIFQHGSHLESFRLDNGEHNDAFDAQGCFGMAAGGGVYAATFFDGLRVSNQPRRLMSWGVGDVGPDGSTLLLRPDGTLDGTGKVFAAGSIQALGGGAWLALDGNYRPVAHGVPVPVTLPGRIYGLHKRGDFIIYHAEQGGRVIVQYADRLVGVEIARGLRDAFRPDLEFDPVSRTLTVMYATEQGEPPWTLVVRRVSIDAFAPLGTSVPPTPIPVPVPQPKPEPVPMNLPDPGAVRAAVEREIAKLPTDRKVTNDEMGLAINNAARGFVHVGLHAKAPGENTARLPDGQHVNRNVLRFHPPDDPDFGWWADVLIGAGTGFPKATAPNWQRGQDDRRSWVAPKQFGTVEPPPPPVEPPPPGPRSSVGEYIDLAFSDLRTELAQLRTKVEILERSR